MNTSGSLAIALQKVYKGSVPTTHNIDIVEHMKDPEFLTGMSIQSYYRHIMAAKLMPKP